MEEIRNIAEELKSNLRETMFPESDLSGERMKPVFEECVNTQTRHVLFGKGNAFARSKRINVRLGKTTFSSRLRYSGTEFPGIMIDRLNWILI